MPKIQAICIYCGSQPGKSEGFTETAAEIGQILAKRGIRLVYGGGTSGLMQALAKACHENGGHVTGIIPRFLLAHEANNKPNPYCDETIITATMHARKHEMFEHADAFLALPGGIGTLEELVEVMTWAQLGRHEKPISIFDIDGFWEPLHDLLFKMEANGFLHNAHRAKPVLLDSVDRFSEWIG